MNREARREVRLATDRKGVDAVVDSIKGRRNAMIAARIRPALVGRSGRQQSPEISQAFWGRGE